MVGKANIEYSAKGLKELICLYDAISFDIFDTLVMRKVYFNYDIFHIVGEKYKQIVPNFFTARVTAERELSKTRYPYMEEIYDHIAKTLGLSDSLKTEIMNYEIEVERENIIPRDSVVDIFNYCKEIGKKVYIVSDMYMHQKDLEDIINKIGIVGYDKIFVSCEYDTSKPQHLFEEYKKEVNVNSYLHIGDSYACDIEPSAKVGIDSFRLMMSIERYEQDGQTPSQDYRERKQQAEYVATKYNSPFTNV